MELLLRSSDCKRLAAAGEDVGEETMLLPDDKLSCSRSSSSAFCVADAKLLRLGSARLESCWSCAGSSDEADSSFVPRPDCVPIPLAIESGAGKSPTELERSVA